MGDISGDGLRWWGWGETNKSYPVEKRPEYIEYLKKRIGVEIKELRTPDPKLGQIDLQKPGISEKDLKRLEKAAGGGMVSTTDEDRIRHAAGKSYRDVIRARLGVIENPPDAVFYPGSEEDVASVMEAAEDMSLALVPYCGGSSVVGGVEPMKGADLKGTVSVDMRGMAELICVDPVSMTARFQAGVWGPRLEAELEKHGLYLGHAPESFKYSGLGGWIASRSAGRQSTGYGKIEEMVESLRMIAPGGVVDTRETPASATGPDLVRIVCGSEGVLGIVTEATVKVRRRPELFNYRGLLFKEFEAGAEAVREIMQTGVVPETIRVSDMEETALAYRLMGRFKNKALDAGLDLAMKTLGSIGYSFDRGSYAVIGCEGEEKDVRRRMRKIMSVCRKHGAFPLGRYAGNQWYKNRYDHPYLRDIMLGWGLLVDTLETAADWSKVSGLQEKVTGAIKGALDDYGSKSIVTSHLSHSYRSGSSLYFIFIGNRSEGREIEQWEHLKRKAGEAILAGGGTISHHHGVGYEHVPWFVREYGEQGMSALRALKSALDPSGIMNPGKLGL
ncbi:MAG: FAD-binding oxidoreductase [Actinobacteria bacterium]|nr:FAD-binding oxidoreductase [Actinomycetota bacterium]